jgi:uncharacterized delta-60 repeat protein
MSTRRRLRSGAVLVAAIVVGTIFSAAAQAAPGDLDLTFSGDGKQTTNLGFDSNGAAATVRQSDGKIVAVGTAGNDFALARYNPNGTLDTSFSGDGKQRTDFGFAGANGVALQSDGKIVAVGSAGGISDFALARYNPNGSLDTSFSGDGMETTNFGGPDDQANGVALQGDGKIVAVGLAGGAGVGDFALARYNPNGTLDTSFSGDGRQTTGFGGFDEATAVALQGNGRIVAVGHTDFEDFALARYNPNGTLDASFSGDGRQTTDVGGSGFDDEATGVALQGNGKVVAVGHADHAGGSDFALARYNLNGSLDTSFSGDGRQTTDFGGGDFGEGANGVALQGDAKIVVVGVGGGVGDFANDFALARYNPNGSLDTSFSGDGRQTTDFGGGFGEGANGVALQPDGKIVAVGVRGAFGAGDFALARYNPNGSLDTSFSGDGKQTTDFGGPDAATGVALQGDGKIIVVGGAVSGRGDGDFALARYNPNGSLDTSFSGDGKQRTDFGLGERARAVALQANGKIVVAGSTGDEPPSAGNFALARYNPNGTLDTSFSGDGKQTTDFGASSDDSAGGVVLQANGKIVAVGGTGDNFALARYNPNGMLDTSFSGDGKQRTDFGGTGDAANGVALQGDGKIVAVGATFDGFTGDFALARYNPNGTLDASFSADGRQTTDFGGTGDAANGVALQANGRIVGVGGGGTGGDFTLARYNTNGSLDTSFSGDGRQTTNFGDIFDLATGVALQGGKIVAVGGGGASDFGAADFALARYNPNGSLDPSFSADGRQRTDFGGDSDAANGVALQADGKIVAVGVGLGPSQTPDFALARYLGG